MKATSFVLPVFGALLASTVTFAGSNPAQTQQTKPAVVGQATQEAGAKADKKDEAVSASKKKAHPAATAATKSKKKTAASRRAHHVKHQAKKTDAQEQPKK